MKRRALIALLVLAAAALVAGSPAHADGQTFIVTTTSDGAGSCGPYPGLPGYTACTTLRAAVNAAGTGDVIGLPDGTYTLSQGELALNQSFAITGANARDTVIQGNGAARTLSVGAGAQVGIYGVSVQGGRAPGDSGGNILNNGSLSLISARVRDGSAETGGGIAGSGDLVVSWSLIDGNTATGEGGGIAGFGGEMAIGDSTITANHANTASGISWAGDGGGPVSLSHVTLAYNTNTSSQNPGGVSIGGAEWTAYGSLFIGNQGDGLNNCASAPTGQGTAFNIEDGSSCEFSASIVQDTGLSSTLTDQGGPTPVLTIPATGPAKGFVQPCDSGLDQRMAPRNANGVCDAGAFEQGAVAPPVTGFQIPQIPTPTPTPTPTATPTATPTPTPVPQKDATGTIVEGKVLIKQGGKFVAFDPSKPIPNGAEIDVTKGKIKLTAVLKPGGKPQTATFYDGIFKLTLRRTTTDLTLSQPLAKCPKRKHAAHAAAKKKKPKTRKLWGDGSGSFRTRGHYSAATVRGTRWLVQDSCAGTLTRVKKGVVSVRDNVRRKTIILRAGKHYLAKPRR